MNLVKKSLLEMCCGSALLPRIQIITISILDISWKKCPCLSNEAVKLLVMLSHTYLC